MKETMKAITAADIKKYFEFTSTVEFAKEWKRLSDEDKKYFKTELTKAL